MIGSLKLFFFIVMTSASVCLSLELTPEAKLRKTSLQLRGFPPSPSEYERLQMAKQSESSLKLFFETKVEEYFNSQLGASKFTEKVFESLRLENDMGEYNNLSVDRTNEPVLKLSNDTSSKTSLKQLLNSSLLRGETWDQILNAGSFQKELEIEAALSVLDQSFRNNFGRVKMFNFKQYLFTVGLSPDDDKQISKALENFETKPTDPKISVSIQNSSPYFGNLKTDRKLTILVIQGALEGNTVKRNELTEYLKTVKPTPLAYAIEITGGTVFRRSDSPKKPNWADLLFKMNELTNRYNKTIYSKSAAFFRIYICDEMHPVALATLTEKSKKALSIIQVKPSTTQTASQASTNQMAHVRPECSGCHDKLDPMQKYLDLKTPTALRTGPIDFVYMDFTGKKITVKLDEGSKLPEQLIVQPQYVRCQSEKFWNWFVGSDVPLSQEKREELESVYKKFNSKPVEVIKYLVNTKDFSSDDFTKESILFGSVRPIFNRCNSCHINESMVPDVTRVPFVKAFGDTKVKTDDHVNILKKIVNLTNLFGHAKKVEMPPTDAGWKLTDSERTLITRWIMDGGKDDAGKDTLTEMEKNSVLSAASANYINTVKSTIKSTPTLRNTWSRILNYSDLIKTIPLKTGYLNCTADFRSAKNSLGYLDLFTGIPIADQPDNGYRESYKACLAKIFQNLNSNLRNTKSKAFQFIDVDPGFMTSRWLDLMPKSKLQFVRDQIEFLIGPNINHLPNEANLETVLVRKLDKLAAGPSNKQDVQSLLPYSVYYILNSDSFQIY